MKNILGGPVEQWMVPGPSGPPITPGHDPCVSLQADDTGNSIFLLLGRSPNLANDLRMIKSCVICYGKQQRSELRHDKIAKVYLLRSRSFRHNKQ